MVNDTVEFKPRTTIQKFKRGNDVRKLLCLGETNINKREKTNKQTNNPPPKKKGGGEKTPKT